MLYKRSHGNSDSYVVANRFGERPSVSLPVPPTCLRLGYGEDPETYIESGIRHVSSMRAGLAQSEFQLSEAGRILDFGCGAGRMTRHVPTAASHAEVWGVDVDAECIHWCKRFLRPHCNFATTTYFPHLPFSDAYFDVIYSCSVFNHLEDTQDAWLLELARLCRVGGRVYITINDKHSVRALLQGPEIWLTALLRSEWSQAAISKGFDMLVLGRGADAQVFYDKAYFIQSVPPLFRIRRYIESAYLFQSAVVLERVATA
ncbi:class I SAM-dependent methyltransferase [Aurantimonas sp. VKM B-3413]|uniref:class I SAM-dependent methyltransferase n=1 Tax=Aurantimonas sp. VKM B-3413 TaxID=2779401 RepID=UPI001E33DD03|nr:class I SAM-dependent methyltransferase [Aurantimonas sp. VKM B-3413]MCB8836119.1 class I SAM-dependent methyltransferase [Aurantimonas sp. VKM B-3413]